MGLTGNVFKSDSCLGNQVNRVSISASKFRGSKSENLRRLVFVAARVTLL